MEEVIRPADEYYPNKAYPKEVGYVESSDEEDEEEEELLERLGHDLAAMEAEADEEEMEVEEMSAASPGANQGEE